MIAQKSIKIIISNAFQFTVSSMSLPSIYENIKPPSCRLLFIYACTCIITSTIVIAQQSSEFMHTRQNCNSKVHCILIR